jgi:hypothetical protein
MPNARNAHRNTRHDRHNRFIRGIFFGEEKSRLYERQTFSAFSTPSDKTGGERLRTRSDAEIGGRKTCFHRR